MYYNIKHNNTAIKLNVDNYLFDFQKNDLKVEQREYSIATKNVYERACLIKLFEFEFMNVSTA